MNGRIPVVYLQTKTQGGNCRFTTSWPSCSWVGRNLWYSHCRVLQDCLLQIQFLTQFKTQFRLMLLLVVICLAVLMLMRLRMVILTNLPTLSLFLLVLKLLCNLACQKKINLVEQIFLAILCNSYSSSKRALEIFKGSWHKSVKRLPMSAPRSCSPPSRRYFRRNYR